MGWRAPRSLHVPESPFARRRCWASNAQRRVNASHAVRVDVVGRMDRDPSSLVRGLLQSDVEVEAAAEVDDAEGEQQDDRGDDRELRHALRPLAPEPTLE